MPQKRADMQAWKRLKKETSYPALAFAVSSFLMILHLFHARSRHLSSSALFCSGPQFFMSESGHLPIVPPIEVAEKIIERTAHEGIFNILEDNPDYLAGTVCCFLYPATGFHSQRRQCISIAIEEQTTYIEEFAFTLPAPIKGKGKPKIIIIIDDLGLSYERSKAVSDLQGL